MKKIKVISLCSGYDSQCLALERLKENYPQEFDYELVAWAEFDPESKQPIEKQPAVVAHNALFPQWADRNVGDMTKADWSKFAGQGIDLLTYSTPCFVKGTLVMTRDGLKNIEDINTDDYVLSHDNQFHNVREIGCKPADCIIKVNGMGIDGIYCTPNHPFYVREMYHYGHKRIRAFRDPKWKQAAELTKNDYLGIAINQENKLPEWNGTILHYGGRDCHSNDLSALLDRKDFWYVIGRYIGDGWTRNDEQHKQVVICFSDRNDNGFADKVRCLGFNPTITKERTTYRCVINSKELMQFVDRFGHYASGKHIDGETFNLPVELLKGLLDGWLDSDGCFIEKTGEHKITTVSKELAYGLQQIVAKAYQAPTRIYKSVMPKTTIIEGREVNQRDFYQITWHADRRKQDHAFYEDGYVWYPCNGTEPTDRQELVYNMEVEDSHSYTANGAIVHNCQSISNAGLQHGIAKDSGTRSSILWYTENAIRILRPKFLLLENVKALASKKFMPDFQQWQKVVESYGYKNYWKILNAKDYGTPQNRERVFMVSILDCEHAFNFPAPFPLQTFLNDVLEDHVDEKYYIKQEKVDAFIEKNKEVIEKKAGFRFDPIDCTEEPRPFRDGAAQ